MRPSKLGLRRLCIAGSSRSSSCFTGAAARRRQHGSTRPIDHSFRPPLPYGPAVQLQQLGRRLAARLTLRRGLSPRERMHVRDPLVQHHRSHRGAPLDHRPARLLGHRTHRRRRVYHHERPDGGQPAHLQGRADGVQIGHCGPAGYQREVCRKRHGLRSVRHRRRRVDRRQSGATGAGSIEHPPDTSCLRRHHHRPVKLRKSAHTLALPCGSRSITAAKPPPSSCATAKPAAIVDFPAPPF